MSEGLRGVEPGRALRLIPLTNAATTEALAVCALYEAAFEPDERAPWDGLWDWLRAPGGAFQATFWALTRAEGPAVIGLCLCGYFPRPNLGYLAYLAVDAAERGQGHGAWLFGQALAEIERLARAACGRPPRLAFWEVRRPEDAPDDAERVHRARRIGFYERLGGQTLPLAYTCPPVAAGQPPVRFTIMARTWPPRGALDRQTATDVALTGLIGANGAHMGDACVAAALRSVDAAWGELSAYPNNP
jgi:GNAT superfamily N-acetyltransferase